MRMAPLITEHPTLPTTPTNEFIEVDVTYHNLHLTKDFELSLIGDVHPGNLTFNKEFYEYSLSRVNNRIGSAMIKMGDVLELNTDSSPEAAMHEQVWTNQIQQDYIVAKNRPLADNNKIWSWSGGGNHDDDRSKKKIGIPKSRDIAQILRVPYTPINAYHIIDFNNHRLILYTQHGKGRTTPTKNGTKRKLLKESLIYPMADIVCIGHTHRLDYGDLMLFDEINHEVYIDYDNLCMATRPKTYPRYLITGHFLNYLKSYGQKAGYPPIPSGYPILKLYPNGCYDVEFVWEPEWRTLRK